MNPTMTQAFLTIWYEPRATIRRIVDSDPRTGVIALVALTGVFGPLANLAVGSPVAFTIGAHAIHFFQSHTWRLINLAMVAAGPLLAIVMLYTNGALLRWAGGLLGGTAHAFEVRAALAWSTIPSLMTSLLYLCVALLGLVPAPQIPEPSHDPRAALDSMIHAWSTPFAGVGVVFVIFGIWGLVVLVKCVAEVHRFSAWKALAAQLIAMLTSMAAIFLLVLLIPLLLMALHINFS